MNLKRLLQFAILLSIMATSVEATGARSGGRLFSEEMLLSPPVESSLVLLPAQTCAEEVQGCTVKVKSKLIPQPFEDPPCPNDVWVQIDVTITCGSTVCDELTWKKCGESAEIIDVNCDGKAFRIKPKTWGGQARGTDSCEDLDIT